MQGRLGKLSYTQWLILLGLLSAGSMAAHDVLTHPLALVARVETYREGQHALLAETSLFHAPAVIRTFPSDERCEAHRQDAVREARAMGHPLPSLTCTATLPRWAGALMSLIPRP
jgi:hypothetical protein